MPEESPGSPEPQQDPALPDPDRSGAGSSAQPTGHSNEAAGGSVDLLNQILQRLQHMEGGLSQHEQWLRRIEEEQRTAEPTAQLSSDSDQPPGDLHKLVGSLTVERDRALRELGDAQQELGRYQQELLNLRQQVTDLKGQLAERDQELTGLKSTATKGYQQARNLQTEAQRLIQARQQQLADLQKQLATAGQQIKNRDSQIAELQAAVQEAAEKLEALSNQASTPADADADPAWSKFAKVAVVLAFASALGSVFFTGWLYQRGAGVQPLTVSATLMLPGVQADTFASVVDQAKSADGVRVESDPQQATVELLLDTNDLDSGISRLNALAENLTAGLKPMAAPASAPAEQDQARSISAGIAGIQGDLAALEATAAARADSDQTDLGELTEKWNTLRKQRSEISASMSELSTAIEARQAQPPAEVTAEQITRAEAADRQLQSEAEAYQQRQEQLAGRLRVSIDAAALQFGALQEALTEADGHLQRVLQDEQPEKVDVHLNAIRESLKTWSQALTELESAWKRQRAMLDAPGGADVLAVQSELEKAARTLVSEITTADAEYARALEAIGHGQDQTTKRLVLRNSLVKQLAPANSAQQAVAAAARAVIATENVELAAIVQRLDALGQQSRQRRAQIAAALRQEQLAAAQQQHARQVTKLRAEYQELARQAAEIDSVMLEIGDQATAAAAERAERFRAEAQRADLLERQAREMEKLLAVHEQFAAEVASLPAPPAPGYLAARLVSTSDRPPSRWSALLLGATPALACAALLAMCWLVISSRRSQQTIEEYARTLKETARRTSLAEQTQSATSEG